MIINNIMENFAQPSEWSILFSQNLNGFVQCICGHRVKRITYLYHKPTKTVQYIGKTCVKKYGISAHVSNPILIGVIKDNVPSALASAKEAKGASPNWEQLVFASIHSQYDTFMTRIENAVAEGDEEIDYYDIVAPFRRLLTNVCDLVSEYGFELVDLLREIEQGVESMNQTTRHTMVDEYSLCDSLSEIASEYSMEDDSQMDTPLSEMSDLEDPVENPVEELVEYPVENPLEYPVENPVAMVMEDFVETSAKEEAKEAKEAKDMNIKTPISMKHTCILKDDCYCEIQYRIKRMTADLEEYRKMTKELREGTRELIENTAKFRIKLDAELERYKLQDKPLQELKYVNRI